MKPEEIKAGGAYHDGDTVWQVHAVHGGFVEATEACQPVRRRLSEFAACCVRDVTPASESDLPSALAGEAKSEAERGVAGHTPGPWSVEGPSQNGHCRRIFAGDEYVATVGGSDQPLAAIKANAALIAAAPDMLRLLMDFAKWDDEHPKGSVHSVKAERALDRLFDRAKAVVKATGEAL